MRFLGVHTTYDQGYYKLLLINITNFLKNINYAKICVFANIMKYYIASLITKIKNHCHGNIMDWMALAL